MTDSPNSAEHPLLLWSPRDSAATNMAKFRHQVARKYPHVSIRDYHDLHFWSIHPNTAPDFWKELFQFEGLQPGRDIGRVLDTGNGFVSNASLPNRIESYNLFCSSHGRRQLKAFRCTHHPLSFPMFE